MSFIEFNGSRSDDFYLHLEKDLAFPSPGRNGSFQKIDGQNGEVRTGDDSLNNVSMSFPFRVVLPSGLTVEEIANDVSNWVKKDCLWHDLYFDGDPDYVYRAIYTGEYSFDRIVSYYGKCILNFTMKPYKFLQTGLREKVIRSGETLTNPTHWAAYPRFSVKGQGNIIIKIGSEELRLLKVDQGVIVDSLYQTATTLDGAIPAWGKVVSYPLPLIHSGRQEITITGTVSELKILPRWEMIL